MNFIVSFSCFHEVGEGVMWWRNSWLSRSRLLTIYEDNTKSITSIALFGIMKVKEAKPDVLYIARWQVLMQPWVGAENVPCFRIPEQSYCPTQKNRQVIGYLNLKRERYFGCPEATRPEVFLANWAKPSSSSDELKPNRPVAPACPLESSDPVVGPAYSPWTLTTDSTMG